MKKILSIAVAVFCIAGALFAAEDWRGNNRMSGFVTDKKTGKPVPGATVKLRIQKGEKGGPDLKTDANGKWALLGLSAGTWNVDIEAPGYETRQMSFAISEGKNQPPMRSELEPVQVAAAAPAEQEHEELRIGGKSVPKEVAEAVDAGNTLVGQKKYAEAVVQYEKAAAVLPDYQPLQMALARAYYGAHDLKKAIASMDQVYKADPNNAQNAQLYANMLLEDGQLEKGKQIIDALPASAVNPDALINTGIVLMNKKQPAAAVGYFSKVISIKPDASDGYYYRGLALIQQGKAKEAKPDLEKVVALAPNSDQATEAKEYLKSIK
jgi:tetratricopeptide (TPR) repeat protein